MSSTSSPLYSVTWAILLGLAAASTTLPATRAGLRLSNTPCGIPGSEVRRPMPVDGCLKAKDFHGGVSIRAIEILSWPLCADGSPAQLAVYRGDKYGSCGPENDDVRVLLNQDEVGTCVNDASSIKFECGSAESLPKLSLEEADASREDKTREGGMLKYTSSGCSKRFKNPKLEYHLPDTCVNINEGRGLSFTQPAVCANGTNALIAGFKGKNCDPTSEPLDEPFTTWTNMIIGFCVPTEGINSMSFWCDGLEGVDMRKPNTPKKAPSSSSLGLILGLSIGLGGLFVIIMGLVVAYSINYNFRIKVKGLFGSGEGYIAL